MSDSDDILTVSEVSQYLKLAESTVYRLAQENKLPCRKVGGTWRFSRHVIDKWLAHMPLEKQIEPSTDPDNA
jgi:excisionase family DNA binding protein